MPQTAVKIAPAARPIRALCLIKDTDRPTLETICGLRRSGCDVRASCPPKPEARELLAKANVPLVDFESAKRLDPAGIRALRAELEQTYGNIMPLLGVGGTSAPVNGIIKPVEVAVKAPEGAGALA